MSEEGLEVPESRGGGPLERGVAIFTALLAALGAVVSFQGTHLMNEVLLKKNEAVLRQAEATNEWNHYQSTSTKAHLMELAQQLAPERAAEFDDKIQKYMAQKDELQRKAQALGAASGHADQEAEELNKPHTRLALTMIFLQIAISIASVTALTRQRWLFLVAILSAGGGIVLWTLAMFHRG